MSHIHTIGIENFRIFKEMSIFDLAPITLLTGTNSSGKSSLIKSMLLLKESYQNSSNLSDLLFTSNTSNLGTFSNCVNYQNIDNQYITFRTSIPFDCFDDDLTIDLVYIPHPHSVKNENGILKSFQISKDDKPVLIFNNYVSIRDITNKQEAIDYFETQTPTDKINSFKIDLNYFANLLKCKKAYSQYKKDLHPIKKKPSKLLSLMSDEEFFSILPPSFRDIDEIKAEALKDNSSFNTFRSPKNQQIFPPDNLELLAPEPIIYLKDKNSGKLIANKKILSKFEHSLSTYVDLLNVYFTDFETYFSSNNDTLNLFLDHKLELSINFALNLAQSDIELVFSDYGNYVFNTFLNTAIKNTFSLISKNYSQIYSLSSLRANTERLYQNKSDIIDMNNMLLDFKAVNSNINSHINHFIESSLQLFNLGTSITIERHQGVASEIFLNKGENKKILLADLGFGYTQLLPIIMKIAIIAASNLKQSPPYYHFSFSPSILILEEPESNLHPSYQSKLADLLINAAQSFNIQFIIETHSEYFIRKFQYLVAKKTLEPKNIRIFYFHDPDNIPTSSKQIKQIDILEDGTLSNSFGTGFFDEADNLVMDLLTLKTLN